MHHGIVDSFFWKRSSGSRNLSCFSGGGDRWPGGLRLGEICRRGVRHSSGRGSCQRSVQWRVSLASHMRLSDTAAHCGSCVLLTSVRDKSKPFTLTFSHKLKNPIYCVHHLRRESMLLLYNWVFCVVFLCCIFKCNILKLCNVRMDWLAVRWARLIFRHRTVHRLTLLLPAKTGHCLRVSDRWGCWQACCVAVLGAPPTSKDRLLTRAGKTLRVTAGTKRSAPASLSGWVSS